MTDAGRSWRGKHVVFLSWRDTRNPEGGGAERYLEKVAAGLVERGCPGHDLLRRPRRRRRPTRPSTASASCAAARSCRSTLAGMRALRRGDLGDLDVVVDVQNGLPFFTRLVTRRPVVVLVHHVHREQWPVVYPGPDRAGRLVDRAPARAAGSTGAASTSRCRGPPAPSCATLGVTGPADRGRAQRHRPGACRSTAGKSPTPTICRGRPAGPAQAGRARDRRGRSRCATSSPDLRLHVVGSGWWEAELHEYAETHGAGDTVRLRGPRRRGAQAARSTSESWVLALPSLKEGWGLVVGEAAAAPARRRSPTRAPAAPASRSSTACPGVLVDDRAGFVDALRRAARRRRAARAAGRGCARPRRCSSPGSRRRSGFAARRRRRRCAGRRVVARPGRRPSSDLEAVRARQRRHFVEP